MRILRFNYVKMDLDIWYYSNSNLKPIMCKTAYHRYT